ncbi:MAG: hypothetical protein AAGK78_14770, partial [Planctomycetota bacterium]
HIESYIASQFDERQQRIDKLQEELAREQAKLAEDREKADEYVERARRRFERTVDGRRGPRDEQQSGGRQRVNEDGPLDNEADATGDQ